MLGGAFRLSVIISKEEGLPRLSPALSDVVFVAEGDIVVGNKGDELFGSFNQDLIGKLKGSNIDYCAQNFGGKFMINKFVQSSPEHMDQLSNIWVSSF